VDSTGADVKTESEFGTPYTLEEAELVHGQHRHLNPYHRDIMGFLIDEVKRLREVIAAEREACAVVAEERSFDDGTVIRDAGVMQEIAERIRRRTNG
jgi:hypothetical protein